MNKVVIVIIITATPTIKSATARLIRRYVVRFRVTRLFQKTVMVSRFPRKVTIPRARESRDQERGKKTRSLMGAVAFSILNWVNKGL